MAITNHERVGKSREHLKARLATHFIPYNEMITRRS